MLDPAGGVESHKNLFVQPYPATVFPPIFCTAFYE
jgi:hypothetical protein